MPTILRIGLENAAGATALAVIAGALSVPLRRRPAVVHVLWVLVLLKLVLPPLGTWPLPRFGRAPETVWVAEEAAEGVPDRGEVYAAVALVEDVDALLGVRPTAVRDAIGPGEPKADRTSGGSWAMALGGPVGSGAAVVWLLGSGVTLAVAASRVVQFRRVLALAKPAPEGVCDLVERVAGRLGVARRPEVLAVPGEVAPMVWAFGKAPVLILPQELWGRLDTLQRHALVAHELAHLKRGDDRVRWLEQAVTVLYWWLPVVWWARRALREAEEQCCDAWVVWALPGAARAYAEALVETVDFLNGARAATPAGASGFGQAYQLKRRLVMIMRGTSRKSLGLGGGLLAFGLSAAMLPFNPSWADEPKGQDTKELRRVEVRVAQGTPDGAGTPKVVEIDGDRVNFFTPVEIHQKEPGKDFVVTADNTFEFAFDDDKDGKDGDDGASAALKKAAERLREQVESLKGNKDGGPAAEVRLKALQEALRALESTAKDQKADPQKRARIVIRRRDETRKEKDKDKDEPTSKKEGKEGAASSEATEKLRAEVKELAAAVKARGEEMQAAGKRMREAQQKLAEATRKLAQAEGQRVREAVTARVRQFNRNEKDGGVVEYFFTPGPGPRPPVPREFAITPRGPGGDQERRLNDLEKKLNQVLERLERLGSGPKSEAR